MPYTAAKHRIIDDQSWERKLEVFRNWKSLGKIDLLFEEVQKGCEKREMRVDALKFVAVSKDTMKFDKMSFNL